MIRVFIAMVIGAMLAACVTGGETSQTGGDVVQAGSDKVHYRFWQGWKKDELSNDKFKKLLSEVFMPATPGTHAKNGMTAYLVALPPRKHPGYIPDEIALVAYESESVYRTAKKTPEGKKYAAMHWDVFDQKRNSHSEVPIDFHGTKVTKLENGRAYDMLANPLDWQKGHTVFFIGTRKKAMKVTDYYDRMHKHVQMAGTAFAGMGLKGYLFLITDDYEIAFMNWQSRELMETAFKTPAANAIVKDAAGIMDTLMWLPSSDFAGKIDDNEFRIVRFAARR